MATRVYNTPLWRAARELALERDQGTCLVSRLIGGRCTAGPLHVHHIVPVADGGAPYDLDNLGTTCSAHHPAWESLRRSLVERKVGSRPRCRHAHRSLDARLICEARLARLAS